MKTKSEAKGKSPIIAVRDPYYRPICQRFRDERSTGARRQRRDAAWTPKDFCERWQFSREVEMRLKRLYERVG